MSHSIRWVAAAAVVLTLSSASAAQAWPAAPLHRAVTVETASRAATAWNWLVARLRPAEPGSRTAKPKVGCGMDPDGKPVFCS